MPEVTLSRANAVFVTLLGNAIVVPSSIKLISNWHTINSEIYCISHLSFFLSLSLSLSLLFSFLTNKTYHFYKM